MAIDNSETTTLAGGCFWCVEAVFLRVEGIRKVTSGYTGGSLNNPTYEEVCSESTGHAEAVQVEFYPKIISFEEDNNPSPILPTPISPSLQRNQLLGNF